MARVMDGASLCSRADTMRSSEPLSRPPGPQKWPPPRVLLVLPAGDLGDTSLNLSCSILLKVISMLEILPG